jgi:hypothetical protein
MERRVLVVVAAALALTVLSAPRDRRADAGAPIGSGNAIVPVALFVEPEPFIPVYNIVAEHLSLKAKGVSLNADHSIRLTLERANGSFLGEQIVPLADQTVVFQTSRQTVLEVDWTDMAGQLEPTGEPVKACAQAIAHHGGGASGKVGLQNAMLAVLGSVEKLARAGNRDGAVRQLEHLKRRLDGCGDFATNDDWITDCAVQAELRPLIDLLLQNLGG